MDQARVARASVGFKNARSGSIGAKKVNVFFFGTIAVGRTNFTRTLGGIIPIIFDFHDGLVDFNYFIDHGQTLRT